MNKIKRLLFLCICTILVSCKTSSTPPVQEETEPVTIHFMHLWSEQLYASKYNVINEIIDDYTRQNPHITVKVEVYDNEQYKDKLKIAATTNDLPDIGVTWSLGYLQPFVEGKLFAELDDTIKEDLSNIFINGTTDAFTINNHTYALPLEFNIAPIFYNKELFEQHQISVPQTYDELLIAIKKLETAGVTPIALGNQDRWTGSLWYLYIAERFAGKTTFDLVLSGESRLLNHPELTDAATKIQDLVNMNAFTENFNGITNEEARKHFYTEKSAMYLMGSWELENFTTNPDIPQSFKDKIGYFKFPYVPFAKDNINSWVGGPGVGLFVSQNSQVKEEAKAFVNYFVREWGEKSVTKAGVIPATIVDTSGLDLPDLTMDILTELKRINSMQLYADVQLEPDDAEQHLNQIQALFGQVITPEEFNITHDAMLYK